MKHMKHIGQDVLSKFRYDEVNGGIIRIKYDGSGRSEPKPNNTGYMRYGVTTDRFQIMYQAHRITYLLHNPDMDQSLMIDHINGIKTDNRIDNLRAVSNQHNHFNRRTNKGFSWCRKSKKFRSDICVNATNIYLGVHETILDARAAYLRAKRKYHVIEEG